MTSWIIIVAAMAVALLALIIYVTSRKADNPGTLKGLSIATLVLGIIILIMAIWVPF